MLNQFSMSNNTKSSMEEIDRRNWDIIRRGTIIIIAIRKIQRRLINNNINYNK